MQKLAKPVVEAFAARIGNSTPIYDAVCSLLVYLEHLFGCHLVWSVHVLQCCSPWDQWLAIVVDGATRHEMSHIHCIFLGTSSPDQLASWWLLRGSEHQGTLYAAAQEVNFDQHLLDASEIVFKDTHGIDPRTPYFLCADGKIATCWHGDRGLVQGGVGWPPSLPGRASVGAQDTVPGPCAQLHGRHVQNTWFEEEGGPRLFVMADRAWSMVVQGAPLP